MPHHDLVCLVCGEERPNTFLPLRQLKVPEDHGGYLVKQAVDFPACCGQTMAFDIPRVAVDAKEPFAQFSIDVLQPDGSHKTEHIGSLRKLRQIEHASEQAHRNGEGAPLVWRDYSNDRSNFDKHTLGEASDLAPPLDEKTKRRFGKAIRSAVEPDVKYGPGVNDANTSALADV